MDSTTQTFLDRFAPGHLADHLGIQITQVSADAVHGRFTVAPQLMAPNGFLHAGGILTLADTCSGYGCLYNLPAGAKGFTTIEIKSNHLGTAREGGVSCVATPVHRGRTTQVWDAVVTAEGTGKTIALFRCTQMILW